MPFASMMTLPGTCPPVFSRLSELTEVQLNSAHAVLLRRKSFSALATACIFHCPRVSCCTMVSLFSAADDNDDDDDDGDVAMFAFGHFPSM